MDRVPVPGPRTKLGEAWVKRNRLDEASAVLDAAFPGLGAAAGGRLPVRRRTPRHRTLVRNAQGVPLLCAWDDCEKDGYEEVKVIVRDNGKNLHYVFCSERHKRMHIAGHQSYGNLTA